MRRINRPVRFLVGTSGYSYPQWKGSFYPAKLPQKEMLRYYAEQFSTVEINGTAYKMPSASVVESWAQQVPASFRFVLKAPQTITQYRRLKNVEEPTDQFLRTVSVLGRKLGPLLIQLHPNFKKDLPLLEDFLNLVAGRASLAFEFRHASWFDDDVYGALRAYSSALCIADAEDLPGTDLVRTAGWGYLRLRREKYTAPQLRKWIERIRSQNWKEAYVFFKHEDTGSGPKLAARFLELAGQ